MDTLEMIKKYNIKVSPSVSHSKTEGQIKWFAGRVITTKDGQQNYVPYDKLFSAPTLEEAVKLVVEDIKKNVQSKSNNL